MSTTFENDGYSVADVQSIISATLHSTILLVFCHGIHTCVFMVALYYIVQSEYPERKRATFAGIITFLWCANTIIVGINWTVLDQVFITNGTSLEAEYNFHAGGGENLASNIIRTLNVFLADLILIWRCWVLYGGDWKIVAAPSLCLITELISASFLIIYAFKIGTNHYADQAILGLVYYSMTVVTNSLCTFLLLFRSIRFSSLLGASLRTYRGIIEVLVESAAMYAAIYIALLIVYAYDFYSPDVTVLTRHQYPMVISFSITGIAPTLIIGRVMARQSRPNNASIPPTPPNMRSTMHSMAESSRFASASSHGTPTGHTTNTDLEGAVREVTDDERGGVEAPLSSLGKGTHVTVSEAKP
ncbi:hypothetical protein BDZ89DRAFT_1045188 [Hymenopellis radicata]|nr:hypothetical protein BDZ89DRAFT_1045188 [Hymenopellis radicata]